MQRGFFITFEGPDGSGKTTQLGCLEPALTAAGYDVTTLRQPGGTALGDRIRGLLLDSRSEKTLGAITPLAELALMFADRAQSIAEVIRPALAAGHIVISDRYTDSSEAYQGAGRQLGSGRVRALHAAVCDNLEPDLTLLLLPDLETALMRARRRNLHVVEQAGADEGRFEQLGEAFYRRIHAAYEEIALRDTRRVAVFREDAPVEAIAGHILAVVTERLSAHLNSTCVA